MPEKSSEQARLVQEHDEHVVIGQLCWTMFKEMWSQSTVILPGENWQQVRHMISEVTEHRPLTDIDTTRAQELIGKHALRGTTRFYVVEGPEREPPLSLEVEENVFNPAATKASLFLLNTMALAQLERQRVLDAFSGSGLIGVYAATRGAQVLAYDTAEPAVVCGRRNATRNGASTRMIVRQGDHTCLLPGEQFDVMGANPPLLPGNPTTEQPLSAAVFDPELGATEAFISAVPDHLAPNGRCYLLTSSVFDQGGRDVYTLCAQQGLQAQLVIAMPRPTEWYRIHEIRHEEP